MPKRVQIPPGPARHCLVGGSAHGCSCVPCSLENVCTNNFITSSLLVSIFVDVFSQIKTLCETGNKHGKLPLQT
ncbi:unnamed protein product [Ixodes persulcatus]